MSKDNPFKEIYCELCDKEVDKAMKYPDGIWVCDPCNKEYPMKEDEEDKVIYYHDTGDENDNVNED